MQNILCGFCFKAIVRRGWRKGRRRGKREERREEGNVRVEREGSFLKNYLQKGLIRSFGKHNFLGNIPFGFCRQKIARGGRMRKEEKRRKGWM
jgi:hypothetical protein